MTIEERFPVQSIQPIAKIESQRRQFYRPIYSVHRSWARRPGSTFRAIGLAHFCDDQLFDPQVPGRGAFYENHNFRNKIALDPFTGGGTSIVELHRLGVKTVGFDVNPVAWFTTKKEMDPFDEKKYDEEIKNLQKRIGHKIKCFYHTECPQCLSKKADIMYIFWVRSISCPSCQSIQDLFKYYIIGKKQRKHPATMVICPTCNHLFYTLEDLDSLSSCPKCKREFIPYEGNCRQKQLECTICHEKHRLIDLTKKLSKPLSSRQIAIEYYCPTCETRDYKPVTDKDKENYEEIKQNFINKKEALLFPRDILPEGGSNITNLRNYGFNNFSELFNERQLLSLSLLLEAIKEVSDPNIQEYLIAAFSSSLEFHTVLCPYNYTMKQIVNIFNYQSYLVPTMYTENNVWGTRKGNGSFITYLEKLKKGKKYCESPFEIAIKEGKITRIPIKGDKIEAINVKDFQELLNSKDCNTLLIADTSEHLRKFGLLPESIDIIITDPPYFDFIQYSELANFFYVWLKLILNSKYQAFATDLINMDHEIGGYKNESDFLKRMTRVFKQCNFVLKNEGPLIFTFHHSTAKIWATILRAIIESGFILTAAFPIHSEFNARPAKGKNTDLVLVCRKDTAFFSKKEKYSRNRLKSEIDKIMKSELYSSEYTKNIFAKEKIFAKILPQVAKTAKEHPLLDLQEEIENIFSTLNKYSENK